MTTTTNNAPYSGFRLHEVQHRGLKPISAIGYQPNSKAISTSAIGYQLF